MKATPAPSPMPATTPVPILEDPAAFSVATAASLVVWLEECDVVVVITVDCSVVTSVAGPVGSPLVVESVPDPLSGSTVVSVEDPVEEPLVGSGIPMLVAAMVVVNTLASVFAVFVGVIGMTTKLWSDEVGATPVSGSPLPEVAFTSVFPSEVLLASIGIAEPLGHPPSIHASPAQHPTNAPLHS
jgi:hypothetical protein